MLASLPAASFALNPVTQTMYTADPALMVHDGTLYLFSSHDEDVGEANNFNMGGERGGAKQTTQDTDTPLPRTDLAAPWPQPSPPMPSPPTQTGKPGPHPPIPPPCQLPTTLQARSGFWPRPEGIRHLSTLGRRCGGVVGCERLGAGLSSFDAKLATECGIGRHRPGR